MSELHLILGPMFAGKTTTLINKANEISDILNKDEILLINHSSDIRYSENTFITSHDKIKIPCIAMSLLSTILNDNTEYNISNIKYIFINEGQFFDDLYEVVVDMLKHNKRVYICGLDSDFERKKFGQILDLIPLCDKVKKLTSLCSQCKDGTPGIFSMRLTSEKQQTLVGSDNYIPVCRKCYENKLR